MPKKFIPSTDYLDVITPDQAYLILKNLVTSDSKIKISFDQLAKDIIGSLDIDEIAEEIYVSLDEIKIEDVWKRSGSYRDDNYKDPYDIIIDDIDNILDPFVRRINSYIRQNLFSPANILCKDILKGLHDFESENESDILSELSEGLEFIAQEHIIDLWDKVNIIEDTESIENFITNELSNWNF